VPLANHRKHTPINTGFAWVEVNYIQTIIESKIGKTKLGLY